MLPSAFVDTSIGILHVLSGCAWAYHIPTVVREQLCILTFRCHASLLVLQWYGLSHNWVTESAVEVAPSLLLADHAKHQGTWAVAFMTSSMLTTNRLWLGQQAEDCLAAQSDCHHVHVHAACMLAQQLADAIKVPQ